MGGVVHGRRGAIVVVAMLLLGGCQGGGEEDTPLAADVTPSPTPQVTPTPTPSPEPPAVDPFSVPDDPADIDEIYVQAVLDELDALDGEMFRIVVREREITEEAEALLVAVYEEPARSQQFQTLDIQLDQDFADIQEDPGDRLTAIQQVHWASASCLFFSAVQDYSAVASDWVEWDPNVLLYLGLRTKGGLEQEEERNPTPWQIFHSRLERVDEEVTNPCID